MTFPDISPTRWRSILRADPCSYCYGRAGQTDHVTARSAGGDDSADNLAGICGLCNRVKRHRTVLAMLLMGFPRQTGPQTHRKPGRPHFGTLTREAPSMFGHYRVFRDAK